MAAPADETLREQVAALDWYHTLELAPGVVTPGWFDTRAAVDLLPLPESLAGKRCLDVGTFDGFWAFELERRGADEVVAVDILDPAQWDWPVNSAPESIAAVGRRKGQGDGFQIARDALGSKVDRREMSVYDLDPDDIGMFDFVYLGSLLIHLRDPVRALERVRSVCRGTMLLVDVIDLPLTMLFRSRPTAMLDGEGRPWWWKPNQAALVRLVEAAGFRVVGTPRRFYMPPGPDQTRVKIPPRSLLNRGGRDAALRVWKGDPHAAVVARPA